MTSTQLSLDLGPQVGPEDEEQQEEGAGTEESQGEQEATPETEGPSEES